MGEHLYGEDSPNDFPKLGTDLVSALTSLNVYDFSHFISFKVMVVFDLGLCLFEWKSNSYESNGEQQEQSLEDRGLTVRLY